MKIKVKREVKIGIFTLLMILCLFWGANFLKGKDIFSRNIIYYAAYDQANGIQLSSAVKIKGFKVGSITDINYDPAKSDKVVLELTVRSKYRIPENSNARVFNDGLMGGKAVEIELGASPRYLESRDTIPSVMDRDFLEAAGSEFDFFKTQFSKIAGELMVTLRTVNTLVASNTANVGEITGNLAGISGSLNEVINQESDNLRGIITNLNSLSATLKHSSDRIDRIITNIDGFTDSLAQSNIPTMVYNLSSTLGELNEAIAGVNEGEGTLGKLISDPKLYDALAEATANLSALLDDVKKNPGRYVHVSVFGRKRTEP